MKKFLAIIGALFLILILLFAFMHFGMSRYFNGENANNRMSTYSGHMMDYDRYEDEYMEMERYLRLTSEEGQKYLKAKEESLRVRSKYGVEIGKKQLELDAELLKENPDWEKIQKINDEIVLLKSKAKIEIMKINHNNLKK